MKKLFIISSLSLFTCLSAFAQISMTCDLGKTQLGQKSSLVFEYDPADLYRSLRANLKQTNYGAQSTSSVKVSLTVGQETVEFNDSQILVRRHSNSHYFGWTAQLESSFKEFEAGKYEIQRYGSWDYALFRQWIPDNAITAKDIELCIAKGLFPYFTAKFYADENGMVRTYAGASAPRSAEAKKVAIEKSEKLCVEKHEGSVVKSITYQTECEYDYETGENECDTNSETLCKVR